MHTELDNSSKDLAAIVGADSHRRHGRKWWIGLALLLVAAGTVFAFRQSERSSETAESYATEAVRCGDLESTITATGNLEPTNEVTIGSELSGTVAEVYLDVNDRVTTGQKLALIEVRGLSHQINRHRAALNAAKASVEQVEATLAENEATLARLKELHELSAGKMPSKAQMVSAEAVVTRSQADLGFANASVAQAQAQLEASEEDQRKSTLVSPIDGVILSRSIEPGQTVAASFQAPELFVIAEDLKEMKLDVAVAEADIGLVEDGQTAIFTVDAWPGRSYEANVSRVSYGSAITDNVVTYDTELKVFNDDLSLRPGMTATADIRVAERSNVLLVPDAALRFDPSQTRKATSEEPKESFVDSLIPKPPGRGGKGANGKGSKSGGPPQGEGSPPRGDGEPPAMAGGFPKGGPPTDAGGGPPSGTGMNDSSSVIWTLCEGQPVPISVKKGLSDGGYTEVSGDEIQEGMPVIIRRKATKQ